MEVIAANQELIVRLIIAALLTALVITTLKAVIKGISGGIKMTKDMLSGVPAEEIMRKDIEEYEKQREAEREKLRSNKYRITHPLEFFNSVLDSKLLNRVKKGKEDGKAKIQ